MSSAVKTIAAVFPKPSGKAIDVKFADGTEALAMPDTEYHLPLEDGFEGLAVIETRTSKQTGLQFDVLTQWGRIPSTDSPPPPDTNEAPAFVETPSNAVADEAHEPKRPRPAPTGPKADLLNFDARELSIMAQVALKEAVPYAAQQVALGGRKTLPTPAQVNAIARQFMKGLIRNASDAKAGLL